jgi:hypothetical protein
LAVAVLAEHLVTLVYLLLMEAEVELGHIDTSHPWLSTEMSQLQLVEGLLVELVV